MPAIIGRKVGMTQIFGEDGARVPLTVIEAGPCHVTQVKTARPTATTPCSSASAPPSPRRLNSPSSATSRRPARRRCATCTSSPPRSSSGEVAIGDVVTVEPFEPGQMVRVTGTSKGKGYAGTIKRHNFKRGPKSHGSHNIRQPGSIGAAAYPARVFKGMRMSGHMGARTVTQRGLQIVDRDPERNLLLVRGAVPGGVNGIVIVRPE